MVLALVVHIWCGAAMPFVTKGLISSAKRSFGGPRRSFPTPLLLLHGSFGSVFRRRQMLSIHRTRGAPST
jgi:hypothetical protein